MSVVMMRSLLLHRTYPRRREAIVREPKAFRQEAVGNRPHRLTEAAAAGRLSRMQREGRRLSLAGTGDAATATRPPAAEAAASPRGALAGPPRPRRSDLAFGARSAFRFFCQIGDDRAGVGPLASEKGDGLLVSAAHRFRQGGPSVVRARIELRSMREKQLDEVDAAEQGRFVERREAVRLADQDIGTVLEQQLRRAELSRKERCLEWRVPESGGGARLELGAMRQENHGGRRIAGKSGDVERRPAERIPSPDRLGCLCQQLLELGAGAERRDVVEIHARLFGKQELQNGIGSPAGEAILAGDEKRDEGRRPTVLRLRSGQRPIVRQHAPDGCQLVPIDGLHEGSALLLCVRAVRREQRGGEQRGGQKYSCSFSHRDPPGEPR
jgi:hypothetical protein